ncbi:NAD(P)H-binding protein [Gemmatimonadota bacterium]
MPMTSGSTDSPERRPAFVTGATGYIGGRLVPRLLERGYRVRCYARSAEKVRARSWGSHPHVEIVEGDLFDPDTDRLAEAMRGCGAAYYLVHAMLSAGAEYIERDREMARRFARSAASAGLERMVYLGGLGELGEDLSRHLASRREVGEVLADGPVPVTELRAAMIIGSGSASFEILRYLTERLPVMITPPLGSNPLPAHCHQQRHRLPDRLPRCAGDCWSGDRHRRG